MSYAIEVIKAYKKFENPARTLHLSLGKRLPRLSSREGLFQPEESSCIVAVDHVSFTVEQGEIFGLLGPGGSGKSTLIRMLATQLVPDGGSLRVFGYDVVRQALQVQRLINRVSVEASLFIKLSAMENLTHGSGSPEARRDILRTLSRLGIDESLIYQPMQEMRRTDQQKVSIARALLSRPRLLLLDEPAAGLDLASRRDVHAAIRSLRDELDTTVLIATTDPREAALLCDRIAVLDAGRIAALGCPPPARKRDLRDSQAAGLLGSCVTRKPVEEEIEK
jgi:ABC-2 type transport system ATP-binding protein